VVRRLKDSFPESQIDYLTKERYIPIVESQPYINKAYSFNSSGDFAQVVKNLRGNGYDIYVDLQANFRSFFLGQRLSGARRLRYPKRRFKRELIVRRLGVEVDHAVQAYLSAVRKLQIDQIITAPILSLPESAATFAHKFMTQKNLLKQRLIAFCPGARHQEKRWPIEHYGEVARSLIEDNGISVLVFSSEEDSFPPDLGIQDDRVVSVREEDILRVAALLARCRVSVTNDSGLMHLANAVGTRVVAIFGPTHPRLGFAPTLAGSRVICDNVSCSPCSLHGQRKCYQERKFCFEDITPSRVYKTVNELLHTNDN
jgi:heptosyltransferase-2